MTYLNPEQHWVCPNCTHEDVSYQAGVVTRMHACKGAALMTMPMVLAGIDAKIELVERGDYVGSDNVQMDAEGKPWMSAITTREDGQDCVTYAPHATTQGVI